MSKKKNNYKLLLDHHRGVYAGEVEEIQDMADGTCKVRVRDMRHAYSWSIQSDQDKGVYALATKGPSPHSKVGPPVNAVIYHVVKIVAVTDEAKEAWKEAKW